MTETVETPSRARPSAATLMTPRAVALLVAGLGAAVYCALAFGMSSVTGDRFGTLIYNYYFLALIEGRFDIPLRIITLEGHYDAAGRAFVYHGLAPLVTRAIAWPFVDLTAVSLAPLTIFLAAAGGTAAYHLVFVQIIEKLAAHDPALQLSAGLLLGIMVWFASPGLLLVANDGLYGEPIAMAYFFVACFLALLAQAALFDKPLTSVLVPMAVFAGLSVYARPHLAVGLYAAVCLLGLLVLWQKGWRGLPSAAGALAILGLFGGALLAINHVRFGNAMQLSSGGTMTYGFHFWEAWDRSEPRFSGFANHGRFSADRIVPNLMVYLFDLFGGSVGSAVERAHNYLLSGHGNVLVRPPRLGMVYHWLPWFVLVLAGLRSANAGLRHVWAPLLATAIGALMMASYGTVAFRYRFDIWPFLAVLAILMLPRVLVDSKPALDGRRLVVVALVVALVPALSMMALAAYAYAFNHVEYSIYSQWSYDTCARMVAAKEGLGPDAVERLCGL
jgi:hypothetical protein